MDPEWGSMYLEWASWIQNMLPGIHNVPQRTRMSLYRYRMSLARMSLVDPEWASVNGRRRHHGPRMSLCWSRIRPLGSRMSLCGSRTSLCGSRVSLHGILMSLQGFRRLLHVSRMSRCGSRMSLHRFKMSLHNSRNEPPQLQDEPPQLRVNLQYEAPPSNDTTDQGTQTPYTLAFGSVYFLRQLWLEIL